MADANPVSRVARTLASMFATLRRDIHLDDEDEAGEGGDTYQAHRSAVGRAEVARKRAMQAACATYAKHRLPELRAMCRARGVPKAYAMSKESCVHALAAPDWEAAIKETPAAQMPPSFRDDTAFHLGLPPGVERRLAVLEVVVVAKLKELQTALNEAKADLEMKVEIESSRLDQLEAGSPKSAY